MTVAPGIGSLQNVQVIFLYHPQADTQGSSIPLAILKRLSTAYGSPKCVLVGQIRYGQSNKATAMEPIAEASSSKLSVSPFVSVEKFLLQVSSESPESLPGGVQCPRETQQDALESLLTGQASSKLQACLVDGLVSAIEMFADWSISVMPIARYIIHILPGNSDLELVSSVHPHSNFNSNHDAWNWQRAATELGSLSAWPSTIAIPSQKSPANVLSAEADQLHRHISDNLPSALPSISDAPSILGSAFRSTAFAKGMLLSGLSDAACTVAKAAADANMPLTANKKRAKRKLEDTPQERQENAKSETISTTAPATGQARDSNAIQKVLFLQQQQQMMMHNLRTIKQQEDEKGASAQNPSIRHRLLDQFSTQLASQHEKLKVLFANLNAGGTAPDLNDSLATLMSIDKKANDQGIQLGGPSNMPALVQRHKQQEMLQQQQQQQQKQQQVQPNTTAAASEVDATTTATTNAAANRSTGPQGFWAGVITWNLSLPNKQRNPAATYVLAQCSQQTKKESLLLPWPQKFVISNVQSVSLQALQAYAAANGTPCVIFHPRYIPTTGPDGNPVAPTANQTNEQLYIMLVRMIDSRKGCAYIKIQNETPGSQASEAGIVVVPTGLPGGASQGSGNANISNRRLLGLVFSGPVPWHLFAVPNANKSTAPTAIAGGSADISIAPALQGNKTPASSNAVPAQGLFQQTLTNQFGGSGAAQQPQPQQQQMGSGNTNTNTWTNPSTNTQTNNPFGNASMLGNMNIDLTALAQQLNMANAARQQQQQIGTGQSTSQQNLGNSASTGQTQTNVNPASLGQFASLFQSLSNAGSRGGTSANSNSTMTTNQQQPANTGGVNMSSLFDNETLQRLLGGPAAGK